MIKYYLFVFLCLVLCFKAFANEDLTDNEKLLSYISQYQNDWLKNKFESAAKEAQKAFELSLKLHKPYDRNHIIIAQEYALILIHNEQYTLAVPILQGIVKSIENNSGAFDEKLIPILGDLELATATIDSQLSSDYALRKTSLHLRYNSAEYVDSFTKQNLHSTPQAKNLAAELTTLTNNNYKILDAGQWDLIYDEESSFDFEQLIRQMDKGYRSALGFLISFNVLSQPPEDKLTAVFFSSRKDYQTYLKSKKNLSLSVAAQRSAGLYIREVNNLYLFDNQFKKNKFKVFSVIRHEIAHQLFFNLGLQSRSRYIEYPRWLSEGLATTLEFYDPTKISGAQTNNYSFKRLSNLVKRIENKSLTPIAKIIAIGVGSEGLASKHGPDIYDLGGFLVRFLYERHPKQLREYIQYLTKTRSNKLPRRSAVFYRHFGEREALQDEFYIYLQSLITHMNDVRAN